MGNVAENLLHYTTNALPIGPSVAGPRSPRGREIPLGWIEMDPLNASDAA
jgi:hypothetical protein